MPVLVGCEESQEVTKALRALGIEAYSCDLLTCSGGHPEWHIQGDIFEAIKGGYLRLQNGDVVHITDWEMAIFFPTCTYLTVSANKWYKDQPEIKSGKLVGKKRREARDLMNCGIKRIAIENPIGCIGSRIFRYIDTATNIERWEVFPKVLKYGGRKPDQIIQPWMFGHGETKATCLWLTNLPKLLWSKETNLFETKTTVEGREQRIFRLPPTQDRASIRSKTYKGIAEAMANQWSRYVKK